LGAPPGLGDGHLLRAGVLTARPPWHPHGIGIGEIDGRRQHRICCHRLSSSVTLTGPPREVVRTVSAQYGNWRLPTFPSVTRVVSRKKHRHGQRTSCGPSRTPPTPCDDVHTKLGHQATAGSDCVAPPGNVTIPAGMNQRDVTGFQSSATAPPSRPKRNVRRHLTGATNRTIAAVRGFRHHLDDEPSISIRRSTCSKKERQEESIDPVCSPSRVTLRPAYDQAVGRCRATSSRRQEGDNGTNRQNRPMTFAPG